MIRVRAGSVILIDDRHKGSGHISISLILFLYRILAATDTPTLITRLSARTCLDKGMSASVWVDKRTATRRGPCTQKIHVRDGGTTLNFSFDMLVRVIQ